jgi:SAM-dependent methyltransferase
MSVDVLELASFYEGALGAVSRRLVGRVLSQFWPDLGGLSLVGLGYATPYFGELGSGASRVLAFMPAAQGVVAWPTSGPGRAALVDPTTLPLPDGSVDRVLVIHALETAESPAELLHEVGRLLSPAGRAVLVCPNRRGLWARMDTTPFGQGQPFSRSQLRRLLRDTLLAPERWAETLYVPPLANRLLLGGAGAWEKLGVGLSLPFAGLHVLEAARQVHRPVPVRARRAAARAQPVMVAVPASRSGLPARL